MAWAKFKNANMTQNAVPLHCAGRGYGNFGGQYSAQINVDKLYASPDATMQLKRDPVPVRATKKSAKRAAADCRRIAPWFITV